MGSMTVQLRLETKSSQNNSKHQGEALAHFDPPHSCRSRPQHGPRGRPCTPGTASGRARPTPQVAVPSLPRVYEEMPASRGPVSRVAVNVSPLLTRPPCALWLGRRPCALHTHRLSLTHVHLLFHFFPYSENLLSLCPEIHVFYEFPFFSNVKWHVCSFRPKLTWVVTILNFILKWKHKWHISYVSIFTRHNAITSVVEKF